jgi:hypothetical protein
VTLFEYLSIAYSLVISFAVLRAASGLPHALASGRRYWVHATWTLINLNACLLTFWDFWSYREIEWTLGGFLVVLANPTLLFILASILVPGDPAGIQSWREYFYAVRVKLFLTGIVYTVVLFVIATVVLNMPLWHPYRGAHLIALGIFIVGAVSSRSDVHRVLVIVLAVLILATSLSPWSAPGSLAPGL